MLILKKNITGLFGKDGETWFKQLPSIIQELCNYWDLSNLQPIPNMTFNYVTKAIYKNIPVVLKISIDKKTVTNEELKTLKHFNTNDTIQVIDHHPKHHAMLLQQAIPGYSLKSLYPTQEDYVIDRYSNNVQKIHSKSPPKRHNYPHISDWLLTLDKTSSSKISSSLLKKAIKLKNHLLKTSKKEIVLHGDLHQDNILKHGDEWLIIDPKGIIGEAEFEIAAFDFIHQSELSSNVPMLFHQRIQNMAKKSSANMERLINWVFVRLVLQAAWMTESNDDPSPVIKLIEKIFL